MTPEIQTVVRAAQAWLQTSWHVQVPFAWLAACVEWIQEEAGEARRLSQQQINQQVLDQWLLTDLRDLDHPVLPEGLAEAQKTELSGTFCVQVDSLLDISQPAYGQLQKWRGSDCANDEVSAVTQTTQRPWEAKPTRVLLLQVTDGVQSLEAMEYQPIPALSTALRPGAKLQLQGRMVCRLGMLLLGPANITVLGGEVEDLVDRNNQGQVLCRTLGLPQEQQQEQDVSAAPQPVNQDNDDLELSEAALMASLEAHRDQVRSVGDSGYRTLSETSVTSSSARSFVSTASSRSQAPTRSYRSGSIREDSEVQAHHMAEEAFPEEDFDDLPLDELDSVIFQQTTNVSGQPDSTTQPQTAQFESGASNGSGSRFGSNSRSETPKQDFSGATTGQLAAAAAAATPPFSPAALEPSHELEFASRDERDFMDVDMDCFLDEVETFKGQPVSTGGTDQLPPQQGPRRDSASTTKAASSGSSSTCNSGSSKSIGDQVLAEFESSRGTSGQTLSAADADTVSAQKNPQNDGSVPALTLTSPPFTYLCLLEDPRNQPPPHTTEIRVKAFIVTLLGKLSSNSNVWSISATISDGTAYLDVELSNEVLTGLLGFSVAEKASLKRDPARRGELDAGMKRCQEELVDMCCVMTVVVEPEGRKAVVTKAEQVSERVLRELEARGRDRRK